MFREEVGQCAPFLAEHTGEIAHWDDVKLLTVKLNHLRKWYREGLLCIGDAAHAMSPVGGVGINLIWRFKMQLQREYSGAKAADAHGRNERPEGGANSPGKGGGEFDAAGAGVFTQECAGTDFCIAGEDCAAVFAEAYGEVSEAEEDSGTDAWHGISARAYIEAFLDP